MDARASEDAAFTMLHEASHGKDISNRYNSLTLPEQRDVLQSMRSMQAEMPAQFGNVVLSDDDRDGILDDATARVVKSKGNPDNVTYKDVYNPVGGKSREETSSGSRPLTPDGRPHGSQKDEKHAADAVKGTAKEDHAEAGQPLPSRQEISRDPFLRQADNLLRTASRGGDIYRQFSRLDPQSATDMLQAMEIVQAAKPQEYANVKLVDANKDGVLDDVRALAMTREGPREVDAFKTPADISAERTQKTINDGLARTGDIFVQEGLNSIFRGGRGPDFGDRVERRMRNEGNRVLRNETNRILRGDLPNILGGR